MPLRSGQERKQECVPDDDERHKEDEYIHVLQLLRIEAGGKRTPQEDACAARLRDAEASCYRLKRRPTHLVRNHRTASIAYGFMTYPRFLAEATHLVQEGIRVHIGIGANEAPYLIVSLRYSRGYCCPTRHCLLPSHQWRCHYYVKVKSQFETFEGRKCQNLAHIAL
jgi:hypothetical protein